jgi:hypothetical protein
MTCSTGALIEREVLQGTLLSCKEQHLPKAVRDSISNGRPNSDYRNKPVDEKSYLLVLSQDCDINNSKDHFIEVIDIKLLAKKKEADPQKLNRNYRKLQLPIGEDHWQLEADKISVIPKEILESCDLLIEGSLDGRSKEIVIDWRVSRYNRVPFPDKFNQDFMTGYVKNPAYDLEDYLRQNSTDIIDLYIYVSPKDEEQAEEYRVSITALISEDCSEEKEEEIIQCLSNHCKVLHGLENSLKMTQIDPDYAPDNINISQELALRMSDFSMLDLTYLRRMTLDYLCY